jgi:hypothetical protein
VKTTFDFHSGRLTGGEILTIATHFLPSESLSAAEKAGLFLCRPQDTRSFSTTYNFHPEKSTMAQPLLGGHAQ